MSRAVQCQKRETNDPTPNKNEAEPFTTQSRLLEKKALESIVEKGENTGNQHFLLFPQCFLLFPKPISTFESL